MLVWLPSNVKSIKQGFAIIWKQPLQLITDLFTNQSVIILITV